MTQICQKKFNARVAMWGRGSGLDRQVGIAATLCSYTRHIPSLATKHSNSLPPHSGGHCRATPKSSSPVETGSFHSIRVNLREQHLVWLGSCDYFITLYSLHRLYGVQFATCPWQFEISCWFWCSFSYYRPCVLSPRQINKRHCTNKAS
jgi:hypothetical protein